jgi:hypothetical protein
VRRLRAARCKKHPHRTTNAHAPSIEEVSREREGVSMSFSLFLLTNGMAHPGYPLNKELEESLAFVHQMFEDGYLERSEGAANDANSVFVAVGPGTIARLTRNDVAREKSNEQRMRKFAHENGLIVPAPERNKEWALILQVGQAQLDTDLEFESFESAREWAIAAMKGRYCYHTLVEGEDYIFVQPPPGQIFMVLSKEQAEIRRRLIVEAQMRQAQQQAQQQKPKIILPVS